MSKLFLTGLVCFLFAACSAHKVDLAALSERARSLLELQSCEYVYHDIVFQGHSEKLLGLITSADTRLLFSVNLVVKAGVVLNQKLDIRVSGSGGLTGGSSVRIMLPEARIVSIDASEDSIHQYFVYEYGLFGDRKVQWLDVQDEVNRAKERARTDALSRGILQKAWDNSATVLKNLLRLAGFDNVTVEHLSVVAPEKSS